MKHILTLLLALGLLCGLACAEEFIEAEEAAVEEIFAVQSEEEPLELYPEEEAFAVEELIPEESLETVEIAIEEMTEASVPAEPLAPAAVTGIKGVPVYTNAARISWDAMSGVSGFQLFRADEEGGEFKWIKNNPTTTVVNYVLTPGADYWYKVRAYTEDKDGKKQYGPFSDVVKVHNLGAIENFTVQPKDTNCSFLKWDKVPGCTGYQVFRTVAGSGEYTWVKNATTNQVANYSLTPGTTYYYKLRAYIDLPDGSRAYGQYSDGIKVEILAAGQMTIARCQTGQMLLQWKEQKNVTGYQLYFYADGISRWYTWLTNTPDTQYTYGKVTEDIDYAYKVRSYLDLPDGSRAYGQLSEPIHCVATSPFEFKDAGDGTLILKRCHIVDLNMVIPAVYKGKTVSGIGDSAFAYSYTLKSVTLPDTITSIGNSAFNTCYSLVSVNIPDGVTSIGDYAFATCQKLKSIAIPNGVTTIEKGAFSGCSSVTHLTIPASVTSIGSSAFSYCTGLTEITIPSSVTSIGDYAFNQCSALKRVVIPDSVVNLGVYAFVDCKNLTTVSLGKSIASIGEKTFWRCSSLTGIVIPDSVTTIGMNAFDECSSLKTAVIGSGVTSIENQAFYRCPNLSSITMGRSVQKIGSYAFAASSITSMSLPGSLTEIGGGVFENCSKLASINLPNSLTRIGNKAFSGCTSLKSIQIPGSVRTIPQSAFAGCSGLTSITIQKGVTTIGFCAFSQCSSITSVTLPDSVTTIGFGAFGSCDRLSQITIPASVVSIEEGAFAGTNITIIAPAGSYAISWAKEYSIPCRTK